MCGILGVVAAKDERPAVTQADALRMRDVMTPRGPDDAGLFQRRNVLFAHRRLAIRDPAAGQQPWISDDGQCVLTYNGEIYNDEELRAELSQYGFSFRTRCDTEVLMAAYQHWGVDCLQRLRGMFAFGLYDFRDNSLLLARDRFGIKPLFLAECNGQLLFASCIAALLAHPQMARRPFWPALSHYLTTFRLTLDRFTLYEGIGQLQPAEYLLWRNGKAKIERYWHYPQPGSEVPDYPAAVQLLRSQLTEAIAERLISDVPVGLFLSGGIDSCTLAGLLREVTRQSMTARCGGGTEDVGGDFLHARRCAEVLGFELQEVRIGPAEYREVWRQLVQAQRLPLSTPTDVVLFRLAEAIHPQAGVVLGGEGADELLCGYAVQHWAGRDFDRWRKLARGGTGSDGFAEQFRQSLREHYGCDSFPSRTAHYFRLNSLIPISAKAALFRPEIWKETDGDALMIASYRRELDAPGDEPTAYRYQRLLHRVNLEGLLSRLDAATMQASVEARVPYTDHRLVESMFRLPLRYKIHTAHKGVRRPYCAVELERRGQLHSKRLLRSVAQQILPPELAHRKKASFPTPVADWLTHEWSGEVRETLLGSRFGREVFRPDVLAELADHLPTAGMWLWPLMNMLHWGEREFA